MRPIDVFTIHGAPEDTGAGDLVGIVEDAKSYFPLETWGDVRFIGKLSLEHDVKLKAAGEPFGAFLFERLISRFKRMRGSGGLLHLLLGITPDPIVATYYSFSGSQFKRTTYLIHDYVAREVGVVSLFRVSEESSGKVVAHGLGHNHGLRHHAKPIDLMYSELLSSPTLQVEGFCRICLSKLADTKADD